MLRKVTKEFKFKMTRKFKGKREREPRNTGKWSRLGGWKRDYVLQLFGEWEMRARSFHKSKLDPWT